MLIPCRGCFRVFKIEDKEIAKKKKINIICSNCGYRDRLTQKELEERRVRKCFAIGNENIIINCHQVKVKREGSKIRIICFNSLSNGGDVIIDITRNLEATLMSEIWENEIPILPTLNPSSREKSDI